MDQKQQRVLEAIAGSLRRYGWPPTVAEMASELGYRSPSPVQSRLRRLEEGGYIEREPRKNRNVRLTRKGEMAAARGGIPILGVIAAGLPILASEDPDRPTLFGELTSIGDFALRVRGDSMRDVDILDGDYAIMRTQETADPGDIVAVIFDAFDSEATLKVYRPEDDRVRFEPANEDYEPIVLSRESDVLWRIVGKFVGRARC